jgi:hypothetical protein
MKHQDTVFKITRSSGACVNKHTGYIKGEVITPHGIVSVYSQKDHSRLDYCHKNKWHIRTFQKELTKQSLIIQATKFVNEIIK